MFIPNTNNKYPYPENTCDHYIKVKMNRGISFNKDYPFVDYSSKFSFKRFWVRLLLRLIVFPMAKIRMGLKIEGKAYIKANKELLKNGCVTICNHVHFWDYICIMKAVHSLKWPYLLAWDKNVNGESGPLVRCVGGIPIPLNDNEATVSFTKSIDKLLNDGNILHVYAEGSMWEYYAPIRPFKKGAASIAIKNNKPILPMAFSYRKPNWIRRKIFKQMALFTLHIGEPLYPNKELGKSAQINDLTSRAHEAVTLLSGQEKSIYPAIYNDSKKIEN
ncbi:MAG: 1-acyl-sn-glycerol-3-phosphate acyltransferase [Bacilli bacterium]|nr:1-acyl-sn-glycerol-3-phosphate acyltransferase [Bacilli bacterium]